jgi:MFS family permease
MAGAVLGLPAAGQQTPRGRVFRTDIPRRLDRLPWSRWHWLVVIALGITWVLDGLEVTVVGAIGSVLTERDTLQLTDTQVGAAATAYLIGAVAGALLFGRLTDLWGRKRLFMLTLGLYLLATILTAFSWSFLSFAFFRFLTGAGIGGEYSAINSAIDELIPARVRGWVDLAINGSYWWGTLFGSAITIFLLNPHLLPHSIGWRLCFGLGAVLGIGVLLIRRYVPESPRWLMIHGQVEAAEQVVGEIEQGVMRTTGLRELPKPEGSMTIRARGPVTFREIAHVLFKTYPTRAILAFTMMITQAFLYNAIFFTYALVLTNFYHVPSGSVGWFIIPFALGNILGPWTLGRLFDTWGRRQMIALTYGLSGALLAVTGWLFVQGALNAVTQTIAWSIIFFFASAGASSAYLTVSEIFPLELRAMAIAFVYAIGTLVGGALAPTIFAALIGTGKAENVFYGYLLGAALMLVTVPVVGAFGVAAEQKSLESIATPLSAAQDEQRGPSDSPPAWRLHSGMDGR